MSLHTIPAKGFSKILIAFCSPQRLRRAFEGFSFFQGPLAEEELRSLFEHAGAVESVKIITDQYARRSRGFSFVEMSMRAEAAKAIQLLNRHPFKGRSLVVIQARQEQRRGRGRWQKKGRRREAPMKIGRESASTPPSGSLLGTFGGYARLPLVDRGRERERENSKGYCSRSNRHPYGVRNWIFLAVPAGIYLGGGAGRHEIEDGHKDSNA